MQSNNTVLHRRQAALVNIIYGGFEDTKKASLSREERGIVIYQNNLMMTATKALSLNYPVIEQMVGEEAIYVLARYLLKIEYPHSGDWADWGKELSSLIKTTPLHQEHPYLASTAELEWKLHQAARGEPAQLDVNSLSRLSLSDLDQVYLHLTPTVGTLFSPYNVEQLWRLHKSYSGNIDRNCHEIFELVSGPQEDHFYLIFQKDHLPCIESLSRTEYDWFNTLLAGESLSGLLEFYPNFDFSHWLGRAIEQQWLARLS